MKPFFVCGMSRTGMAWTSVLLTTDVSLCHPEAIKTMRNPKDIERLVSQPSHEFVGIADPNLAFFPDMLLQLAAPIVVLERDKNECVGGLVSMGVPPASAATYCDRVAHALGGLHSMPRVLRVDSEKLKSFEVARQIFWHCLPGRSFDEGRFAMLHDMMIEGNPAVALEAYARNKDGMRLMFAGRLEQYSEARH